MRDQVTGVEKRGTGKWKTKIAGVENAGPENEGPRRIWKMRDHDSRPK